MTEELQPSNGTASHEQEAKLANLIYILYLVGLVVGVTAIVGVVMAYVYQEQAPAWIKSHHRFQIRTFWIGMLYSLVGLLLLKIGIGALVILFTFIWFIVRTAKGLGYLNKGEPVPNPADWMFG